MMDDRISALRRAVDASPDDPALRLVLAETLDEAARTDEAIAEYEALLHRRELPGPSALRAGHAALAVGRIDLARGCLEAARAAGVIEGVAVLQGLIEDALISRGLQRAGRADPGLVAEGLVEETDAVTFADVGGLDDVKKVIHRTIVLPLSRPDLYERYGRRIGGGVLLYGPPGCGKTLIARATAGECGLPFIRVRIEQILDPWVGGSERNMHDVFEHARSAAPCVVFLDEIDALGYARRRQQLSATRNLVDVLLHALDSVADVGTVLVLAATNVPWDVDDALLRPGRFDRRIFVPPPDEAARIRILELLLHGVPTDDVDVASLARASALASGADLRSAVERAIDATIDAALERGHDGPVARADLDRAVAGIRPTTVEWLERARNYVEFANTGDRYAEVAAYLASREVRKALKRAD